MDCLLGFGIIKWGLEGCGLEGGTRCGSDELEEGGGDLWKWCLQVASGRVEGEVKHGLTVFLFKTVVGLFFVGLGQVGSWAG